MKAPNKQLFAKDLHLNVHLKVMSKFLQQQSIWESDRLSVAASKVLKILIIRCSSIKDVSDLKKLV